MSRLQALRKARGWSRLELATRAGVTESTIIRAERSNGRHVQGRSLEKIARALGSPSSELLETPDDAGALLLDDGTPDPDVLFIHDLANALRTSVRRLKEILKTEPWKLPERLPAIDKRDRWSRVSVDRWLELVHSDRKRATGRLMPAGR